MLREAIKIIRELFGGRLVSWRGDYFQVDSARLWDMPDVPVGIAVAMGAKRPSRNSPGWPTTWSPWSPTENLSTPGRCAPGRQSRRRRDGWCGQIPVCWDPDRDAAIERGARPVPLVRRWLEGQRRSADAGRLRRGDPIRATRRRAPTASPAGRTWMRSSKPSGRTGRPGSPTSRSSRSAEKSQERFLKEAAEPLLEALRDASGMIARLGRPGTGIRVRSWALKGVPGCQMNCEARGSPSWRPTA